MNRTEEFEQARVVKWSHKATVRKALPALSWLYHCPNGGNRSAFTGAQMKALGVKKGQPDLLLPVCRAGFHGLVIEMKATNGRLTEEQKEWLAHYEHQGWQTHTCHSAEEAHAAICSYFNVDPGITPLE